MNPLLIDLFCGEGGAAMGYHKAGFEVIGVDIKPQKRYPFPMVVADALNVPLLLEHADAIHASPPCQRYSDLAKRNKNGEDWPDLVGAVRTMLHNTKLPFVIENVEGAPLKDPVVLCGTMFPNLRVIRHRLFETNWDLRAPQNHPKHPLVFTYDKRKDHYGKLDQDVSFVQVTGGGNCTVENARSAMGMDWASKLGLNEAIPPAYTEHIGKQLIKEI